MDLNSDSTIYYSGDGGQGTLLGLLVHHYLLGGVRISLGDISKKRYSRESQGPSLPKNIFKNWAKTVRNYLIRTQKIVKGLQQTSKCVTRKKAIETW